MKTRGTKRFVSLLISAAMTIGVIAPLSAFAAGNSISITAAENGSSLKVKAALVGDEAVTGTAVAAVYNEDNELLAVKSAEASAEVSFTFDRLEDAKTAKVMWWDSLSGMTPQANSDTENIIDTGIYVLMNIPYNEFYSAASVTANTDYDTISSATNKAGNYGKSGGAYHSGTTASVAEDGTVTAVGTQNGAKNEGVIWPVKVSDLAALESLSTLGGTVVTDETEITVATLGRGQTSSTDLTGYQTLTEAAAYSYYILSDTPAYYIELLTVSENKPVFGSSHGTVETKAEITPTVTYGSNWGDVQLGLTDAADINGKQINAVIITAENTDGVTVTRGLVHLSNVWSYSDIAWRNSQIDGLNGATLKNIRYYCNAKAEGDAEPTYYVYDYPMNVKLLPAYEGTVTAEFESNTSIALSGLPEDIENPKAQVYYTTGGRNATYTYLTPLAVDPDDDDIDPTTVNIADGKIAIDAGSVTNNAGKTETYGTPVDGTTYTIAISSDNYAPFKVTAEYTVRITGYTPIPDVQADYVSQAASFYDLPKTVTFNLSDGTSFDVKVMSWAFEEGSTLAPEGTATAKAILDNIPTEYSKYAEDIEKIDVTATVKFNEAEETDEIKVVWEPGHVTSGYSSDTVTYPFDENPKAAIINYDGDGSDITLTTGYPTYLSLSVGNGLSYDTTTKTLTIQSDKFLESGYRSSTYSTLKIGDSKTVNFSMSYTTDRSVAFEKATSGYSGYTYSSVSRKRPLVDTVTFTNVPDEDIEATSITFSDSTAAIGVTIVRTDEDGVYTLTIPYDAVSEHIASGWSGDYASLTLNVRGMAATSITVNYMAAPSLSLNQSSGYYASENPVVTVKNFSFDQTTAENLVVSWSLKDSEDKTPLTADTDYTFADGKIILDSASILGGTTLSEEKTITLYVEAEADEEAAQIDIRYKKDRTLAVADVSDLSPYSAASAQLSGSEEGYTGLQVYYGETKIENTTVSSSGTYGDYTYYVTIPYASISEYLDNNAVTLTAKLSGCPDAEFTVTYGEVAADGASLPIETTKVGDSYGDEVTATQDDLPKVSYTGTISVIPTEDSTLTKEEWLNMGATIKKKDGDTEISIGAASTATNWSTGGIKAVVLGSLYSHKDELDAIDDFDSTEYGDGTWPVYTITLYKAGYAPTEIDVVLFKYRW